MSEEEKLTVATEEVNNTPTAGKKKRSKKSLLLKIVIGIVAFVVILFVFVNSATSEAVKISDQFISSIQNVDGDSAYNLFSDAAKANTDQQQFANAVDRIGPILKGDTKITSKDISAGTDSKTTSNIVYQIIGTDGTTYNIAVVMVKVDGNWQVENFTSEADQSTVPADATQQDTTSQPTTTN